MMKIKPGSFLYAVGVWHHFWKLAGYPVNKPTLDVLISSLRVWKNTKRK